MVDLLGGVVLPSGVGIDLVCHLDSFCFYKAKAFFRFTIPNAAFTLHDDTKADLLGGVVLPSGVGIDFVRVAQPPLPQIPQLHTPVLLRAIATVKLSLIYTSVKLSPIYISFGGSWFRFLVSGFWSLASGSVFGVWFLVRFLVSGFFFGF